MMVDYVLMGKRIKNRRKELHLTQSEVTERAGLNDKYISNIERATSIPSINTLVAICKVLDISIDFLLDGITNNKSEITIPNQIMNIVHVMDSEDQKFTLNFLKLYHERLNNKNRVGDR